MEIKIYQPYLQYETRFFLKKERDLNEIESLILLAIKFSGNEKSKNLIDFLSEKFNLDKNKWQDFIIEILECSQKTGEINKKEEIGWKDLLVDEIEFNPIVSKNLEYSNFKGLESQEIVKDKTIYVGLWNRNDLRELIDPKKGKTINDNAEQLIKIAKSHNNEGIINECGEKLLNEHNAIFFRKEFLNKEKIDQYNNILFFPTQTFDFEIKGNRIVNNDKLFSDLLESYQKNHIDYFLKSQLEEYFSTKVTLDEVERMNESDNLNQEYQRIEDFNLYQQILETRTVFKRSFNSDPIGSNLNFFFYKNDFIILKQKIEELTLKTSNIKVNITFLYYKKTKINIKNFVEFNIENKDLLKIWEQINEQNLKTEFKTELLNNVIRFFAISQNNKQWVIQNINDSNNIDKDWLFSTSVSYDDFKNMFLQPNNKNLLEVVKNHDSVLDFDDPHFVNSKKVNWLYEQFKVEFQDLNISSKQLDIYDSIINFKYDQNNLDSLRFFIKKLKEETAKIKIKSLEVKLRSKLNQLKITEDELIQKNKDTIIDQMLKILNEELKGGIDDYLKELTELKNKENKVMLDYAKENKLVDQQTTKKLEWLNKRRNQYAHSKNEDIRNDLSKKDLNILKQEYEELKRNISIITKEN